MRTVLRDTTEETKGPVTAQMPEDGGSDRSVRCRRGLLYTLRESLQFSHLRPTEAVLSLLLFSLVAGSVQWYSGAYGSGFGAHPDEPGHYVTGLMVYKYLTTAPGSNPVRFAERFYAHYPLVAFGHWPPLFYFLQAAWGLFFGLSRTSVLILMAAMSGAISAILHGIIRARFGRLYGMVFALVFLLIPIVQRHTSAIMAEAPLTLFTVAAIVTCSRYLAVPTPRAAALFGVCLCAAIVTKGNAWALIPVPVCTALLSRSKHAPIPRHWWIPAALVLVCCVPLTVATSKMTMSGWDHQSFSLSFVARALPLYLGHYAAMLGPMLVLASALGIYITVIRPLLRGLQVDIFWACNAAVVLSVLLFHCLVPTSVEPRKLFMSLPSLVIFGAAGANGLMGRFRKGGALTHGLACALFGFVAVFTCVPQPADTHSNMGPVAQDVLARARLDRTAILVASSELNENAELSLVAEIASREGGNYGHAVLRAGKIIEDSSWLGSERRLLYSGPDQVSRALRAIPISAVVLYTGASASNAHLPLVRETLRRDPEGWNCQYAETTNRGHIELFVATSLQKQQIRLPELDMRRTLGRTIQAEF